MPSIDPQAESLFAAAAELSGEARTTFLDRECEGQEGLRRQLEGLLRAHDRINHAIDRPVVPGPSNPSIGANRPMNVVGTLRAVTPKASAAAASRRAFAGSNCTSTCGERQARPWR